MGRLFQRLSWRTVCTLSTMTLYDVVPNVDIVWVESLPSALHDVAYQCFQIRNFERNFGRETLTLVVTGVE